MFKIATLVFFMNCFSFQVLAVKSPADADLTKKMSVEVQYGDLLTRFEIQNATNKVELSMKNNRGFSKRKSLSNSDWSFLKSELSRLPAESNDPKFCPNKFVQAQFSQTSKFGCLGSDNKMARGLQNLANLLSAQF